MDIRTKLIFALVAVALASMFVFGAVVAPDVEGRLRESTLSELDELAESKREGLNWIIHGWHARTALVASRTQLRASLAQYRRAGGQPPVGRIRAILADAVASSASLTLLRVTDTEGEIVASATNTGRTPLPARSLPAVVGDTTVYAGVEFLPSGPPQVSFLAPLVYEGERVGTLLAVFEAFEIAELTGHAHGLGDSGEVLLVAVDADGEARTLHPTRHDAGNGAGVTMPSAPGTPVARALAGAEEPVWQNVVDYRGELVWAATRFIGETGWGLVVKIDDAEQTVPYEEFEASLTNTALVLSAFAILAGFGLGLRFAIPIHELAEVANRIRRGELGARANVAKEDEVGLLARTFNQMAGELEQQISLLHEYQKFFDVSVDLMCMAGTDGFFKRVNPAFERELGWSREELLESPFLEFVHPDDVESTQDEVAKLAQGIPTISFENRYRCRDGRYKRLRWATYPDAETGMLYAIAHVMDDLRGSR